MLSDSVEQIRDPPDTYVAHVISDAGPHPYFRTLIEHGRLQRTKLLVGCVGPAGPLQEDMRELGVPTFALGARSRAAYPVAAARLARLLRRRRTQIVQTHLVDGSLVGLTAARLARISVTVMTAHHSHELPFHGPRLRASERLSAGPLSDWIIAPSESVARTLIREAGVSPAKIEVIHHGFDLAHLDPSRVSGESVRAEFGLQDSVVLGAVGRYYRLKNQAALIRAFAGVCGETPQLRLLLVGGGDPLPLQKLVGQLGIAEKVVISPVRRDIPSVLAACDLFVHPAIAESFGMVIIEAMAMARPVLSTPVGIAPDVIKPPHNGWLTNSTGSEALQLGLRLTLTSRRSWQEIGAAARRSVAGFTAEAMARRYEDSYASWLARPVP